MFVRLQQAIGLLNRASTYAHTPLQRAYTASMPPPSPAASAATAVLSTTQAAAQPLVLSALATCRLRTDTDVIEARIEDRVTKTLPPTQVYSMLQGRCYIRPHAFLSPGLPSLALAYVTAKGLAQLHVCVCVCVCVCVRAGVCSLLAVPLPHEMSILGPPASVISHTELPRRCLALAEQMYGESYVRKQAATGVRHGYMLWVLCAAEFCYALQYTRGAMTFSSLAPWLH